MNDPDATPADNDHPDETTLFAHQRLWTPWRMNYVGGGKRETGCIFCNRQEVSDDVKTLILHRGVDAFVIMNLFPYNTGHTMIVPTGHVGSPEDASPAALAEMAALQRPLLRSLRRALGCAGFNLGMNVGAEAGAGIAEHLHLHVVPRWTGDASFMPILANTMVMPEMIPISYIKLRAELARELSGDDSATCVVLTGDDKLVLVDGSGALPTCAADVDEPVWKSASNLLGNLTGDSPQLVGWAGETIATACPTGLTFRVETSGAPPVLAGGWYWQSVAAGSRVQNRHILDQALENLVTS